MKRFTDPETQRQIRELLADLAVVAATLREPTEVRPVVWRRVWTCRLPFRLAVQFGREW